jgi:hypothetical protein
MRDDDNRKELTVSERRLISFYRLSVRMVGDNRGGCGTPLLAAIAGFRVIKEVGVIFVEAKIVRATIGVEEWNEDGC